MSATDGANLPFQPLGPSDLIRLSVYDSPELSRSFRVDSDGALLLPLLKQPVKVSGLLPDAAAKVIAQNLKEEHILVNPVVDVSVVEYRSRAVTVSGAVKSPQTIQEFQETRLLDAINDAGGFSTDAGPEVVLERPGSAPSHVLVKDLLEVSRFSTGRIDLRRKQVDMRGIVEGGVETVRPLSEQRRHTLAVHLPPSPIWIDGDSTRLEQVVVNLLTNAAKYTDEGGQIGLRLQQEGNEAVLRVRDSGVGIAPDLMPRIFTLFTQADQSLARSQGGLGIGLALVQRLVEMHEGRVEASSTLGKGSEFVVRLPVVSPPQRQAPSPPTETAQPTGPSLRVLVVDDNVDTVTTLAMLVQESGHEVRTAYDGSAVLEAALDYRPNLVLLDIGLPGLNGFEVAKRLRQQPALQNAVLVAMTGYGQESDRQRSQEAGFDHHLVKPGDFGKVLQILATCSRVSAR